VTAAGSWVSFASGKETGWDFYNNATAATHHKAAQAVFLGCNTGLLTLGAILMRCEIAYNVKTLIGKETAYPRKKSITVPLHLLPGGFLACGEF